MKQLERLGGELPELLQSHGLRRSVDQLGVLEEGVFNGLRKGELIMAARIYAFLASGYVHQVGEEKVKKIPRSLAVPLYRLSKRLGRRFPILSYDLYCLNNWRRVDPEGPIRVETV